MPTVSLMPNAKTQFLDSNGAPLAGGSVGYYVPNTLTLATIYTDPAGTVVSANPVPLNGAGEPAAQIYGTGSYRQIVKDINGVTYWDDQTDAYVPLVDFTLAGLGAAPANSVRMIWSGTAWIVYLHDGSILNTSASTTQGLQEAINAACTSGTTPGWDLYVIGGNTGQFAVGITCYTPIVVPPLQGKTLCFHSVSINFTHDVTGPGFTFDSMELFDVQFTGSQITYGTSGTGTGPALLVQPAHGTPGDGIIAVTSGRITFPAVAIAGVNTSTDHCVQLDTSFGPIIGCQMHITEINGTGNSNTTPASAVGLFINDPGSGHAVIGNRITIDQIHEVNTYGIQIGQTTASNSAIVGNIIDIGSVTTAGSGTTIGVLLFGSYNMIRIGDTGFDAGTGSMTDYMNFGSGSAGNKVEFGRLNPPSAGTFSDSGTDNFLYVGAVQQNNKSLAASGFVMEPSGLIRNWGTATPGANSGVSVNFAKAFPNQFLGASVTANTGVNAGLSAPSFSGQVLTGMTVNNNFSAALTVYWEAWGN